MLGAGALAHAAASCSLGSPACPRCLSSPLVRRAVVSSPRCFSSSARSSAPTADWRSIPKQRLSPIPPKPAEATTSNAKRQQYWKQNRLNAKLNATERAQLTDSPTVALLFRRAGLLTEESAWTHPRRGRDRSQGAVSTRHIAKYAAAKDTSAPEVTVHTTAALEHARTCNEVVRQLLDMQRRSVTPTGKEGAPAPTIAGRQPEVIPPFVFNSAQWFLLLAVLRSLPGELVAESTIDALWAAISIAHIKPAAWDSLVARHAETQLNGAAVDGSKRLPKRRAFAPFTPNATACNMFMSLYVSRQDAATTTDLSKVLMIWFWMREHAVLPAVTTIQLLLRNLNWRITQKVHAGAAMGLPQRGSSPKSSYAGSVVQLDSAESAQMAQVLTQPASMDQIAEMGRIRNGKLSRQVVAAATKEHNAEAATSSTTSGATADAASDLSSTFVLPSIQLDRQLFEEIWVVWESICRGTDPVTNAGQAAPAAEKRTPADKQQGDAADAGEEKDDADEGSADHPLPAFQSPAAQPDTPSFEGLRFAAESFKDVVASVTNARRAAGEAALSSLAVPATLPPLPSLPLAAPRPFLVQAPWFVPQSHRDQFFHAEVLRYLSLVAHPALGAFFASEIMSRISGLDVGAGKAGQELYDLGGSKIQGDISVLHQVIGAVERGLKMVDASKEIKLEANARNTRPERAVALKSTLAALDALGSRHDLVYLFSRFWEVMESIGVRTDEGSILQRMRILSKTGLYDQVKTAFEALHPDPNADARARQDSPALLNPFALARRAKQDAKSDTTSVLGAAAMPLNVVSIYSTAIHALRHVHRAEFASGALALQSEQLAQMIERGAGAAAVAASSLGLPVCPLPPSLLTAPIASPFARYLRQFVLAPIIHSPSIWSFLSRTFFVQIMLALERQCAEEAHAQQMIEQQAKLPSFARAREELQGPPSTSSPANEEMWLIFMQLSALRAAQQSAPLSPEVLDPSDRGVGRRKHRFEAHRMMSLEFFCILLRNLHRSFNQQHLDEKGWGRAASSAAEEGGDPLAKASRVEYHRRVEAVFDECLSIHGLRMRDFMRETSVGRAALKSGLEDWTRLREPSRAVMGPAAANSTSGSSGLTTENASGAPITFVMLLNSYFEALSRVPEGCASVERNFERFFTRQPAALLKDASRATALELKQKDAPSPAFVQMQLQPNSFTVTAVLRCYLRSGVGSDRIQAFVRGLANRFDVAPTVMTYQAIMASIEEMCERRWEERTTEQKDGTTQPGLQALALYREMLTKRMLPSSPLYLSLLRALSTLHPSIPVPVFVPVSAGPSSTATSSSSDVKVAPSALVERVLQEMQADRTRREAAVSSNSPPLDIALKADHFEPLLEAYARAGEVAFAEANAADRIAELATEVGSLTQKSHRLLQYLFERSLGLGGHADATTKQLVSNVHILRAVRKLLVLRHAMVLRLPASHPMTVNTPPLVPTLVVLQRSFLTKQSRKVMMAAGGPVEVLLRDAIHELHRLESGGHNALLSLSLSSLASFLKDDLLVSQAPAAPLLTSTHYAQLMHLYTAFPALPPLVTDVASSAEDQWLPGWALFGRSQLEGVTPSPRLILSVFRALQQARQHSAGLQLYSNMLFMGQIAMPSNVHAMVWPQVMHMASTAPRATPAATAQDRVDLDAWLSSTSNTGLCLSSPWTVARSLMYSRFHSMSPLDLHSFWKVLERRPTIEEQEQGEATPNEDSKTHERARLAHASSSDVVQFWERLMCARGLTPYLGRVGYVDLLSLGSATGLGQELESLCVTEEEAAAEMAALETSETLSVSRALPANPLESPVSSASSRALVSAHVSGVLQCCLESMRLKKRTFPEKAVTPMLIRVGSANLTEEQQIYLPRDLKSMVSQQLRALGLAHASVQLNSDQVHDQFKPFPASAPRKSLAGEYVRIESKVLTAFLNATNART